MGCIIILMGCRSSCMKKARWVPLCLPATKNHQSGLGASEDESDAKIFSVLDSETGQQSPPPIQLELMPRQPQQV